MLRIYRMRKVFLFTFFLINTFAFCQNIDDKKIEQLSITISEETCNCIQKIKEKDENWFDSIENCFLESFKKNESKVKQLLGANYLDQENGKNILQIIRNSEAYWVNVCLDKLKSEETFALNLVYYFNDNANLTYDLTSFIVSDAEENTEVEEEIVEEQIYENEGVVLKFYFDKYETQYVVVKIDTEEVHFMVYDEFDNYKPYFKEKKLKINDKVSIKYSVLNLFDDDKNQYVDEKRILNIEKI